VAGVLANVGAPHDDEVGRDLEHLLDVVVDVGVVLHVPVLVLKGSGWVDGVGGRAY